MTDRHQRPTARIYAFPARRPSQPYPASEARAGWRSKATEAPHVACDGWYHEAALRAADPARSH